jgi:hypothetical protein
MEYDLCQTNLSSDLNLIYETMPSGLLSDEGYHRLTAVTDLLPAALTNFWGLECRLHDKAPLADVLFEVKRNTTGQKLLAGQGTSALDELCRKYTVWQEIRAFSARWTQKNTLLNTRILNLWLEFDTEKPDFNETASGIIGQPSVFLGFRSADLSVGELRELLRQSKNVLQISEEILERIVSFIGSIPPPGQLFQLGSMLGRSCRDTRVCINNLSPDVIPAWLIDMGWKGNANALKETMDILTPIVRTLAVDLSLTETGISEKIGIECYMDWNEKEPGIWADFLDRLDEYVYLHPSKSCGLLQYPGELPLPFSRRNNNAETLSLMLFKMIHHVKLGFHKDGITDVKAYVAIYRPGIQPNNNWLVE